MILVLNVAVSAAVGTANLPSNPWSNNNALSSCNLKSPVLAAICWMLWPINVSMLIGSVSSMIIAPSSVVVSNPNSASEIISVVSAMLITG